MHEHLSLMPRHTFLQLEVLTQIYAQRKENQVIEKQVKKIVKYVEVDFILYNKITQKLEVPRITRKALFDPSPYLNSYDSADCSKDTILVFIREKFEKKVSSNLAITEAIRNSTFSVNTEKKEKLIKFMGKHHAYNFVINANTTEDKQGILDFMTELLEGKGRQIQAKKWYNNILKRLKYECICIMEKSTEEKKDTFAKAIRQRDKRKKIEQDKQEIDEILSNIYL